MSFDRVHRTEYEILLDTEENGNGYQYPVDLYRADTPEKVLQWVAHLGRKTWITPMMLADFVELAFPSVWKVNA